MPGAELSVVAFVAAFVKVALDVFSDETQRAAYQDQVKEERGQPDDDDAMRDGLLLYLIDRLAASHIRVRCDCG